MAYSSFSTGVLNRKGQGESSVMDILEKVVQMVEEKNQSEPKALVLTVKEAAEELQISIPSLRDHFLCRPDFPKIRAGSKILIPRKAFEDWLNKVY